MAVAVEGKRSFFLGSRGRIAVLRACGIVDVVAGAGFALAAIGVLSGTVVAAAAGRPVFGLLGWASGATVVAVLALWSGLTMIFSSVIVTPTHLASGQSARVRPRVDRESVIAVNIEQRNFGRAPRSVPVAALRDGSELRLMPLASLLSRSEAGQRLATQHAVVTELRQMLGVGGTDLHQADIR